MMAMEIGTKANVINQYNPEQFETPIIDLDFLLPLKIVRTVAIIIDKIIAKSYMN